MMLRFGQLIVNGGVWPDAEGRPQQLIDAGYIEQMLTPQFPDAAQNYGLLTWLTTAGPPAGTGGRITGSTTNLRIASSAHCVMGAAATDSLSRADADASAT